MNHMGKVILVVFSLVVFHPALGSASSISVSWNANTESDLAGYKIYYGDQSRTYSSSVNVGKVTSYQLSNVSTGKTYYIALTAYDTSGNESGYSSESSVYVPVQQAAPSITLLTPKQGEIVSSNPLLTWSGTGMVKYKVFVTLGKSYYTAYNGTGTSCRLSTSLWSLFIPSGSTIYWYVEGTTSSSQVYKSSMSYFKKR
jgi:hypothetical protein